MQSQFRVRFCTDAAAATVSAPKLRASMGLAYESQLSPQPKCENSTITYSVDQATGACSGPVVMYMRPSAASALDLTLQLPAGTQASSSGPQTSKSKDGDFKTNRKYTIALTCLLPLACSTSHLPTNKTNAKQSIALAATVPASVKGLPPAA